MHHISHTTKDSWVQALEELGIQEYGRQGFRSRGARLEQFLSLHGPFYWRVVPIGSRHTRVLSQPTLGGTVQRALKTPTP